jgi:hypothetical protein
MCFFFFSEPNENLRTAVESFEKSEMHNTISKSIQVYSSYDFVF